MNARIKHRQVAQDLISQYRSSLTSTENARSEVVCEFWHGTGTEREVIRVLVGL